jgi:hypothetical protein
MAIQSEEIKNLKQLAADAKAEMDRLLGSAQGLERANIKLLPPYKEKVKILKETNEQVRELLSKQKESTNVIIEQEGRLKGLLGLQSSLVDLDRDRLTLQDKIDGSYSRTHEAINSIASLNQELLALSSEDIIARQHIEKSISDQLNDLKGMGGVTDAIVENLDAQFIKAKGISSMTEKQQKLLNKQLEVYEGIKDTIGGIFDTLSLLTSGPTAALGLGLVGAGFAADKLGANIKKFGGFVDSAQFSALGLGMVFEDAEETAISLSQQFGGLKDVSFATQLNTNLMANNMGITGDEAANVVGSFARLNNNSADIAVDMAATTKSMAKAAGVPISKVMKNVAQNTEAFASYGKDGGINIAKAAVAAAKLGVEMDSLTKVTDSLLDFETSITNELELGAMLGKNINLDRARALAYEGNIGGAVKETLQTLGGIEEFNKMDIFQKRKAAELLGLSVDEFQKMAANSDKLNDDGSIQLSTFDSMTEALTGFVTGPMGGALKGMGGMVIAAGQLNMGLGSAGTSIGGMAKGTMQVLKNLISMIAPTKALEAAKALGGSMGQTKLAKGFGLLKDKLLSGVGSTIKPENLIAAPIASVAETATASAGTSIAGTLQEKAGEKLEGVVDDKIGAITSPEGIEEATQSVNEDKSMGDKLKDLAKGLKSMGNTQVLLGALNLIPTGLGFLAMLPGIPSLFLLSKMDISGVGKGLENLARGMKKMADGAVFVGALALVVAAGAFAIMAVGVVGMAAIALLGAPTGAGLIALAKGLKSFGNNALKGVAVLGLLAGVIGLSAIAFQQFAEVDFASVIYGGIALAAFALGASIIGNYADKILVGSLAIAALGIALIPFTYAMSLLAGLDIGSVIAAAAGLVIFGAAVFGLGALMMTGVGAFVFGAGILALLALGTALVVLGAGLNLVGSGFSAISSGLPSIIEQISALSTINFLPILGLAGALTVLSIALAAVAATGMLALPALIALGLFAGAGAALVGGGDTEDRTGELIDEIKGLRADLIAGKIGVNIDGVKVTSKISGVVDKVGSNSYAKI